MTIHIALFRGINVGGNNCISMKVLTEVLGKMGCEDVRTYIQSGNVVFQMPPSNEGSFAQEVGKAIRMTHGFEPEIITLRLEDLEEAIRANPFPTDQPKCLHLYFLSHPPKTPNFEEMNRFKADTEKFQLMGAVFYLYAPEGIGRSKLAAKVEKALGVKATARNWNTVTVLREMALTKSNLKSR